MCFRPCRLRAVRQRARFEEQAGPLLNVQTLLGIHDLLLVALASETNS